MNAESTNEEQSQKESFAGVVYPILIGFGMVCAVVAVFSNTTSSTSLAIVSAGALIGGGLLALSHVAMNRP